MDGETVFLFLFQKPKLSAYRWIIPAIEIKKKKIKSRLHNLIFFLHHTLDFVSAICCLYVLILLPNICVCPLLTQQLPVLSFKHGIPQKLLHQRLLTGLMEQYREINKWHLTRTYKDAIVFYLSRGDHLSFSFLRQPLVLLQSYLRLV